MLGAAWLTNFQRAIVTSAWNPLAKGANQVLSFGNRTVTQSTGGTSQIVLGTQSRGAGLYKVEFTPDSIVSGTPYVGICTFGCTGYDDTNAASVFVSPTGAVYQDGLATGQNIGALTVGQPVSFELNRTTNRAFLQRQGGTRTEVGPIASQTYFPAANTFGAPTSAATINTGSAAFGVPMTAGYSMWG